MSFDFKLILFEIFAYLCGSIPFGLIISKLTSNIDIREYYNIRKYPLDGIKRLHDILYKDHSYINIINFFDNGISRENMIKFMNPYNFMKMKSINVFINAIDSIDYNYTIYNGINKMMSADIDIIVIARIIDLILNTGIYSKYYSIIAEQYMGYDEIFYDTITKMIKNQININLIDIIALCDCIEHNHHKFMNMDDFNYVSYSKYLNDHSTES